MFFQKVSLYTQLWKSQLEVVGKLIDLIFC